MTMRAMVLTDFGDPEVFEEREVEKPEPGVGEVRVRVHATSVNPIDTKIRRNGDAMGVSLPEIIGYDVSGVVDSVGPGVERFSPGDEVFYTRALLEPGGSYAEFQVSHESIVAHKPAGLSHTDAASLPTAACTAWDGLVERAGIEVGETVLVQGVGGVGSHAVQIASAAGTRVLASSSPATVDLAENLGVDRVSDYRSEDFAEVFDDEGVAVVFTTVGGGVVERAVSVLEPHGRMVDIVGDPGDAGTAKDKNGELHFMALVRDHEKLDRIRQLVDRGQLRPVVDDVLPLSSIAEAHGRLEAGGIRGKIVLSVD